MRDEMEYTERQSPAARRPVELVSSRVPRGERSHQGTATAHSGDVDEAPSDPTRHHPGTRLGRDERSARRRCRDAHRRPADWPITVSEAVEERVNDRPTRLGEAVEAVHVAQRCGTDRWPACHVPLPGGEKLPREHHSPLRSPAGREARSRLGCRTHDLAPATRQTGRSDHARHRVREPARTSPGMSCKGTTGSTLRLQWIRPRTGPLHDIGGKA